MHHVSTNQTEPELLCRTGRCDPNLTGDQITQKDTGALSYHIICSLPPCSLCFLPSFLPAVLPFVCLPSFLVNSTGQLSQEVCATFVSLV